MNYKSTVSENEKYENAMENIVESSIPAKMLGFWWPSRMVKSNLPHSCDTQKAEQTHQLILYLDVLLQASLTLSIVSVSIMFQTWLEHTLNCV